MLWLLLIVCTALTVELFLRLNLKGKVNGLNNLVQNIGRIINSKKISDHWKEVILPVYAGRLFKTSLTLFAVMVAAFSPFIIAAFVGTAMNFNFVGLAMSLAGIGASIVIATIYLFGRAKIKNG